MRCAPYSEMPKTIAAAPGETSASPRQSSRHDLVAVRLGPAGSTALGQKPGGEKKSDDPHRKVHEEDPAPGQVLDDRAADHRAEHRRQQHRHADDAHHAAHAVGPRGLGERDHPDRHDHPAGEALKNPEADQRLGAPRQAAQAARHHEGGHRGHPHLPGAEPLRGPSGERDRGGERQQVAGAHPLDRGQRGAEVDPQRLQRHVHDRRVEDRHDRADHHHHRDAANVAREGVGHQARAPAGSRASAPRGARSRPAAGSPRAGVAAVG